MKRLFTLVLCLAFAVGTAEAKTYYVNAKRPNNNGNGLKLATAKKTIQAAINLAKAGDTILVYPGEYAPIKTQNKKITIKSKSGASKTKIVKPASQKDMALAQLGKPHMFKTKKGSYSSAPYTTGNATTLSGFLLDGKKRDNNHKDLLGVSGGTAKSCSIQRLGKDKSGFTIAACGAKLVGCTVQDNVAAVADSCVFSRCKIAGNESRIAWEGGTFHNSRFCNCLITGNRYYGTAWAGAPSHFGASTLVNCTVADNRTMESGAPFSYKSKFYNCILRSNRRGKTVLNVDSKSTYSRTFKNNKNPKFANQAKGNYKLAKGSPCINQGTVPAAIKPYVGSVDLGGGKRVKGKAIDMGCYEY